MKKYMHKAAAVLTVLGMLVGSTVSTQAGFTYDPVSGSKTQFDKYLVMDKDANCPKATFTFTVKPGAYHAGTKTTFEVLAGVGTPTIAPVTFSPTDTVNKEVAAKDVIEITSDEGYAKQTATVDFSGCSFTEPGVYRYLITESGSNMAVTNDENVTRTLDVYVTNEEGATSTDKPSLKVSGYILHSPTSGTEGELPPRGDEGGSYGVTGALAAVKNKSVGYRNSYETEDLIIQKHVKGNQASHDQYFHFTLTMSGAVAGTKYTVDLSNADATSGTNQATASQNRGKPNPSSLEADANGALTADFYLQNGQSVKVCGLASGTKYTVKEDKEDYVATVTADTEDPDLVCQGESVTDESTGITADTTLMFVNTRGGVIPTGLFIGFGSSVAALMVLVAAILMNVRRRSIAGRKQ